MPEVWPIAVVSNVYADVDNNLWLAARSSVHANLQYLRSQP
ncbi:hypothetical protein [Nocardia cyriacigeorgica]